jgi:hypothetical protein
MPILNSDSLKRIKLENDRPKQIHGRPVSLISDLLETIHHLKKEKNKWQDLASKRGAALRKIQADSARCLLSSKGLECEELEDDTSGSLGNNGKWPD